MSRTFFFLAAFLIYSGAAIAASVVLEWSYPEDATTDGFKIYYKTASAPAFDYSAPVVTVPSTERRAVITVPGIDGKITSYQFTARAFRGDRESEDSNICETSVDLAPIDKPQELKCFIDGAR